MLSPRRVTSPFGFIGWVDSGCVVFTFGWFSCENEGISRVCDAGPSSTCAFGDLTGTALFAI